MPQLNIGDKFSLPLEFVTSTQAILARKRSGKSYTASVQAEELLSAGQQIAVVDPTGAWWGMKSSANGLSTGFPIVVFGGEHADVPLESTAGEVLARTLVEQRFSAIFDLSLMGVNAAIRFVTDFMNELFRVNRAAMHLFIDEADAYCPQKPFGEEMKSLHAVKRLVKQGGIRGIGVTMITQRPQVLNKDVLSQVDILTVLRMSHPLDVKAAVDWISSEVDPEFANQVKKDLPSLPVGTAYISSAPLALGKRVQIRPRTTFNSGATPKAGESRVEPKVLAQVDIDKLGVQIAETVERAKANDPKQLQKRIKELEAQAVNSIITEEVFVLKDMIVQFQEEAEELQGRIERYDQRFEQAAGLARQLAAVLDFSMPAFVPREKPLVVTSPFVPRERPVLESKTAPPNKPDLNIKAGAKRMLTVLVQWMPAGRTESQVAAQVSMKQSGTFSSYKSALKTAGFIRTEGNMWYATEEGREFLGIDIPDIPTTTKEIVDLWAPKLKKGAREMLDVIIKRRGHAITKEELASAVGMVLSGTFSSYLSDLRTTGMVITDGPRVMANRKNLLMD